MKNIMQIANKNQKRAWHVIKDTDIVNIWKSVGAEINLVGSLKTGLLMSKLDIDFHIYTKPFNISDSFKAISKLAENKRIKRIKYNNLLYEEDMCLEWHAYYEDEEKDIWQIDMIHILKESPFAGVFEEVAERISMVLTDDIKERILTIKSLVHEKPDVQATGIEIYKAVIDGSVKTFSEFIEYQSNQKNEGIILWKP